MGGFVVWMRDVAQPNLNQCMGLCLTLWLFVVLPMLFVRHRRGLAGYLLVFSSYVPGLACWVYSFTTTYYTMGPIWAVIGLLFLGLGVFPLAVLGSVIHSDWSALGILAFMFAIMCIPRLVGWGLVDWQKDNPPED